MCCCHKGNHIQEECKRKGVRLDDFLLEDNNNPKFSLLIGADFYWHVVSGKVQRITDSLVAIKCSLGWTMQGPISSDNFIIAQKRFEKIKDSKLKQHCLQNIMMSYRTTCIRACVRMSRRTVWKKQEEIVKYYLFHAVRVDKVTTKLCLMHHHM